MGNKTAGNGGGELGLELDVITENEHVGKILELLCGIGAAYKYLCQVSLYCIGAHDRRKERK